MDVITKGLLEEFIKVNEIKSRSESDDFEKFVCSSIISNEYNVLFDCEEILTDPHTQGIDGIGIIVNGKLVDDTDTVQDLIDIHKGIECTFVFIQSKTSTNFSSGDIGNFYLAVKQFFISDNDYFKGEKMKNFIGIKDYIYKNSHLLTRNPDCKIYYVTTGSWQSDANIKALIESNGKELRASNLLESIDFFPCGANEIQRYYRKTKEEMSTTFLFEKRVTIPVVDGINESYFGIIPFKELKKIIADESENIRSIFYDNIRDFLGENPVNQKIEKTLKDGKFGSFGVLNNGITIVADTLQSTGDQFTVKNYQIVNGCQTSHVLFNNRNLEGIEQVNVPFRLIVTNDDDIKNEITKATNSQTEVKQEELEALSEFQKNLEQYYNMHPGENKLNYERRTNQYNPSASSVYKTTIITIPNQIKIFSAMFLENPHLVSRYYGTIAKEMGEKIFKKSHEMSPYYTSGLASYKLETFFRNGTIEPKYKKARYHILMLFRMLANNDKMATFDNKNINKYCKKVIDALEDNDVATEIFKKAIGIIDDSPIDMSNRDFFKRKEITETLIKKAEAINKLAQKETPSIQGNKAR